nr:PKD domain-containing protein [Halovenus carboxidivorans]
MDAFFDRYVRSRPPEISVPDPTVYDGPNDGAALDVRVPEFDLDPGEREPVTVTLANTGTETSLAPQISVNTSGNVTVELIDSDGSVVTDTDEGWVFDHLPAGEAYDLTFTVEANRTDGEQIAVSAGDLSNQRAATSVTLDSSDPLGVTLSLPAEATAGEQINATATTTPEEASITRYSFSVTGPGTQVTADSSGQAATFTPEEAGTYTVSVTATAADGRTATTEETVDVSPVPSDDTSEETDDTDGSDGDGTDGDSTGEGETTDGDDTSSSDGTDAPDQGGSDGFGDGFGPAVGVGALLALSLLARRAH